MSKATVAQKLLPLADVNVWQITSPEGGYGAGVDADTGRGLANDQVAVNLALGDAITWKMSDEQVGAFRDREVVAKSLDELGELLFECGENLNPGEPAEIENIVARVFFIADILRIMTARVRLIGTTDAELAARYAVSVKGAQQQAAG